MSGIPQKKRSKEELQEMRRQNAFAVRPPIQQLQALALPKFLIGVYYFFAILSAIFLLFRNGTAAFLEAVADGLGFQFSGMIGEPGSASTWVYCTSVLIAGFLLLECLYIFVKKTRSRHHATILFMISLLVIIFGILYLTNRIV